MTNTVTFTSNGSEIIFNPISSALTALPNGAGTIATLWQAATTGSPLNGDVGGLTNGTGSGSISNWYHTIACHSGGFGAGGNIADDDGFSGVGLASGPTFVAGHWYIIAITWPGTGASVERISYFDLTAGGSWTHANSSAANGGLRAGPSTTVGQWNIGYSGDFPVTSNTVGLSAAWAGAALTDLQVEALSANSRTSDWWNNAAGQPTLLVECTSLTPTDIGAHTSTFKSLPGTATLTGAVPTGWTFDQHGSTPTIRPGRRVSQATNRASTF